MASQQMDPEHLFRSNLPHTTDSLRDDVADASDRDVQHLSGEDAHSIMEVSISPVATRLTSSRTSRTEEAVALQECDGLGLQSDERTIPPAELLNAGEPKDTLEKPYELGSPKCQHLSLNVLSSPSSSYTGLPTPPWHAEPKKFVAERPEQARSALREALALTTRRSFSGSGEALKKFLPSMPKAPSFMPSLPSLSVNVIQRSKNRRLSLSKDPNSSLPSIKFPFLSEASAKGRSDVPLRSSADATPDSTKTPYPRAIRRVASDESLLYHSISRASSLGDDARFEHHTEMLNSRLKAIKDSLQDRSSFRLPSLPSLPSMPSLPNMPSIPRVPSFNFNVNFAFNLNSGSNSHRRRADIGSTEGTTPNNDAGRSSAALDPVVTPGTGSGPVSSPEAAAKVTRPVTEAPKTGFLNHAMANLTGDVVIMGGYRGSVLRSARAPHRQVWVPVKVGLNIRRVNLEVGLEPEDEERMEEQIFSSGMIQNIGPVDISKRLFKRLRECENVKNGSLRIWDYGYDWRLSPHLLSRRLIKFLESLPSNQNGVPKKDSGALVIAHSLGGLITRHAINQRPELFAGVVYAGVPNACINILGPLRNGDAVMLSSRVLTAQVNFTLRTSFLLLPLDGVCFVDINTKEKYPVDFFDVQDWVKYRWSPCTDPPLPPKAQPMGALANILRTSSLTSLPLSRKRSSSADLKNAPQPRGVSSIALFSSSENQQSQSQPLTASLTEDVQETTRNDPSLAPQSGNLLNSAQRGQSTSSSVSTAVTIPRDKAIAYLRRTLAETKQFKLELEARPDYAAGNRYPPLAVIYGKSAPTVCAAKVDGRDGIACADAYDNLAFASGDGVCLAREAMPSEGYLPVSGGRISSERGHLTLLGDLSAVGRAIEAVVKGRAKGLGLGE